MSKKILLIGVLAITAIAQILIPLSVISKWENVLKNGVQYKFKTAPVDPYDAFRGRYVALRFEQDKIKVNDEKKYYRKQNIFVTLDTDKDGYVKLSGADIVPPEVLYYLKAQVNWTNKKELHLDYALNRYYMNEHDAPKAEKAYWKNSRRENKNAYVTVRVLNGCGVIEKLYIDGKPVEEYIKK